MVSSGRIRTGCCLTALVVVALGTGLAAGRGTLPGPSPACPWVSTWWGVVPHFTITRTGVWNAGKNATAISSVMATEIDTTLPVAKPTLNTSPAGAEMAGKCAPATFTLNDASLPAKSTLSGTWITPTGSGSCRNSARWGGGRGGAYALRATFDGAQFHVMFAPRKRFARLNLVIAFGRNLSCSVPGAGTVYFGPSNSFTTNLVTPLLRVPVAALVHDRAFSLTAAVTMTHTQRWNGGTETQKLVLAGRIRFVRTGCNTLTSLSQQPRKVC